MYVPAHFAETRPEILYQLVLDYPLATLITQGADGLVANHLPLQLIASTPTQSLLRGHVARANPVWREHDASKEVLVIFNGPQAYITPSWYATKQETGRVVPTWNYTVVHVRGRLRVIEDASWLRSLLDSLTTQQEATVNSEWQVGDAPADYIERLLGAIVGVEIEITSIVGKWKVSQNQPDANRAGVISGLESSGNTLAALVPPSAKRS